MCLQFRPRTFCLNSEVFRFLNTCKFNQKGLYRSANPNLSISCQTTRFPQFFSSRIFQSLALHSEYIAIIFSGAQENNFETRYIRGRCFGADFNAAMSPWNIDEIYATEFHTPTRISQCKWEVMYFSKFIAPCCFFIRWMFAGFCWVKHYKTRQKLLNYQP